MFDDLRNFDEIHINKGELLKHDKFIEFGNDISLTLATEKQIENFSHTSIISFDGRFIQGLFKDSKTEVLAFDLSILQYFY
jgi:hypothetical protein